MGPNRNTFSHFLSQEKKNADVIIITRQAVRRAGFFLSSVSTSECLQHCLPRRLRSPPGRPLFLSRVSPLVRLLGPARRTPNGLGLIAGGGSDSWCPLSVDGTTPRRSPGTAGGEVCHRRKGFLPVCFPWTLRRRQVSGPLDHQRRQILRQPSARDPQICLQKQQGQPSN